MFIVWVQDTELQRSLHRLLSIRITTESLINAPSRGESLITPALPLLLSLPTSNSVTCHYLLLLTGRAVQPPHIISLQNMPLAQSHTVLCSCVSLCISVKLCCFLHSVTWDGCIRLELQTDKKRYLSISEIQTVCEKQQRSSDERRQMWEEWLQAAVLPQSENIP